MDREREFLTTTEAARLLGCSRQHVVDLCTRDELPSQSVGTHRRVRRADVEAFAGATAGTRARLPEQVRSLWLHRAVAGRLARDPERVLARARRNLDRLERTHPTGVSAGWLARWRRLVEQGPEAVMRVLVAESADADEFRQNSPFAGVLREAERLAIIRAHRRHGGPPRPTGTPHP